MKNFIQYVGKLVVGIFLWFLIVAFIASLFSSCKTKVLTEYVPVEVEKTISKTETIHDTIIKYVPEVDSKQNIVQPSDTSKLDNKYAVSWAWFDGLKLHHWLKTKQDTIPIAVKTKNIYTTITMPVIIPVKQPAELVYKIPTIYTIAMVWAIISMLLIVIFIVYSIKFKK